MFEKDIGKFVNTPGISNFMGLIYPPPDILLFNFTNFMRSKSV